MSSVESVEEVFSTFAHILSQDFSTEFPTDKCLRESDEGFLVGPERLCCLVDPRAATVTLSVLTPFVSKSSLDEGERFEGWGVKFPGDKKITPFNSVYPDHVSVYCHFKKED